MPPICGTFYFQKNASSGEDIVSMMSSFPHQKDYDLSVWKDEFVAFGQRKSKNKHQPTADSVFNFDDNLIIIADARLDNKNEVFEELGISGFARRDFDETALIAAAYRKWGEDCSKHLLGNFVFAVWDKKAQKLFISHDHLSLKSLFYYIDDEKFIFATSPKAITTVNGVEKRLNRNKLIDLIISQAKFLFSEETWFENIFALPAGTSLIITKNNIRRHKFWEPELGTRLPLKKESEILEAFRELMFRVVSDHIQSEAPVSALLRDRKSVV